MTSLPRLFLAAALSACALVAAPALAGVEHQPQDGTKPAYEVEVPDGWVVNRDEQGNLYILAGDHSGGLILNIVAGDNADHLSLDDLAAQLISLAQAPAPSRTEADAIGGVKGKAFYSTIPEEQGAVSLKLVLVKLDATHVASEGVIENSAITPDQHAALMALAARVRFIR